MPANPAPPPPTAPPPDSLISHASALTYWNTQEASVTGMLGGLPHVSRADIQGSKNFLAKLRRRGILAAAPLAHAPEGAPSPARPADGALRRAADCGAGIGRVTRELLAGVAGTVDIVEPVAKFSAEIAAGAGFAALRAAGRIGRIYSLGLEAWTPAPRAYDVLWHQWCLGQLTDAELVAYLGRAAAGLAEGGVLVVKENCASGEADEFDAADSSVTRSLLKWRDVFRRAGCRVEMEEMQRGFPPELFAVRMWALKPV